IDPSDVKPVDSSAFVPGGGRPSGSIVDASARKPIAPGTVIRWYERRREGQKLGWSRVAWTPSTWEGKRTVHDTTTESMSSTRKMMSEEDTFTSESVSETERGEDGTLWWMRTTSTQSGTTSTSETKWVGDGYEWTETTKSRTETSERRKVAAAE